MVAMPTKYTNEDGATIEIDGQSVTDLKALAALSRTPEHELLTDAIERLRQAMVPSTKPVAPRAGGRGGNKAPKDKQ